MNPFSGIWVKIGALATFIVGLLAWRQKGISDAIGNVKAKERVKDSIAHIEKLEKEKEDVKTVHEIENTVDQLDDGDVSERLRTFR